LGSEEFYPLGELRFSSDEYLLSSKYHSIPLAALSSSALKAAVIILFSSPVSFSNLALRAFPQPCRVLLNWLSGKGNNPCVAIPEDYIP